MPTPFITWFLESISHLRSPNATRFLPHPAMEVWFDWMNQGYGKPRNHMESYFFESSVQKNRNGIQILRWISILKQNRGDYFQMNATNGTLLPQVPHVSSGFFPSAMIDIESIASNFPSQKNPWNIHSWIPPLQLSQSRMTTWPVHRKFPSTWIDQRQGAFLFQEWTNLRFSKFNVHVPTVLGQAKSMVETSHLHPHCPPGRTHSFWRL